MWLFLVNAEVYGSVIKFMSKNYFLACRVVLKNSMIHDICAPIILVLRQVATLCDVTHWFVKRSFWGKDF